MFKSIALSIISCCFAATYFSADLVVEPNGLGGAYMTIQSAVNAASAGDRILIFEDPSPYIENVSINKSLQLVPAVEGDRPVVVGFIQIGSTSLAANSEITISGLRVTSWIQSSSFGGNGTTVNVVDCELTGGSISFDQNGFIMNVANNSVTNGHIAIRRGRVVGNTINTNTYANSSIYIGPESAAGATDVPNYIVGNTILTYWGAGSTSYNGIYWNNNRHYAHIANNFITAQRNYQRGVYLISSRSGGGINHVSNNTFDMTLSLNNWTIYATSAASTFHYRNNVILSAAYGIGTSAFNSNVNVSYNQIEASITALNTTIVNDGTNNLSATNTIDANGQLQAGSTGIDAGNPDAAHTDLDLTQNDAGCYGGSFSKENFDQANASSGAVTSFMLAPRRVLVGQTIEISADGFDK